jgi:hypothetical protein
VDADILNAIFIQTLASIAGVFIGALAALAIDHHNTRSRQRRRARTLTRILTQELAENYQTLKAVQPAFEKTDWGKSFYLSTVAWETALASGDLPEILGYDLADTLAVQYGWLSRIRYYVDLLTRLWLAPQGIHGYEEIRSGFRSAILAAIQEALAGHQRVMERIEGGGLAPSRPA